jgi:threonine/homoserine efflux transporter RhtA
MSHDPAFVFRHALIRTTLGAVMISFSAVFVKIAQVTPTGSAFYRVFFGGCFLLVILLVRGELRWYGGRFLKLALITGLFFALDLFLGLEMVRNGESFAIPDVQTLSALVGLGLMCQTLGWFLIGHSLPKIPAAVAGLVLLLQPSLSFVWDVLFFNRETSAMAWTGVVLALCAIYIGTTSSAK